MTQSARVTRWSIAALCALGGLLRAAEAPKPHDVVELAQPVVQSPAAGVQVPAVVPARPQALLEPDGKRIYHGVCINAENAAAFPGRIAAYTATVGHRPAVLVQFAHAFDREKALDWDYHAAVLRTIAAEGLIPFLKATTQTWDNNRLAQSGLFFRAADILAGKHDAFFRKAAQVCREFGRPMLLAWNHEMNGDWYSYSEAFVRQRPEAKSDWTAEKYIRFFRRVRQIFRDEGADNVAFAFAPVLVGRKIGDFDEAHSWKAYYPGDDVVDWLAPSYYNEIRPETFDVLAAETNKPIFVSEWGSSANRVQWYNPKPYPGDGVWMARTMELWRTRYPNLKGSAYYQWEAPYLVERSPAQLAAYRTALTEPVFIHGPFRPQSVP